MAILTAPAILCAVRAHGEHGAIARALTAEAGLMAGFVPGGRSSRLRPVLVPGNRILATFKARTTEQLAGLSVELVHSVGPLIAEPLAAAAIDWGTSFTAAALTDAQPHPALFVALEGLLDAIEVAPSARGWAVALVRYELLMLADLGFGLDLARCAVTGGTDDLAFVSPRTGRAVSREGAIGLEHRLMPLPAFLVDGGETDWPELFAAFDLTGRFIERMLFADRRADALAARERLLSRLKRAVA